MIEVALMSKNSNSKNKFDIDSTALSVTFLHPFKSMYLKFGLYVAISNTVVSVKCIQLARANPSRFVHFLTICETQLFLI